MNSIDHKAKRVAINLTRNALFLSIVLCSVQSMANGTYLQKKAFVPVISENESYFESRDRETIVRRENMMSRYQPEDNNKLIKKNGAFEIEGNFEAEFNELIAQQAIDMNTIQRSHVDLLKAIELILQRNPTISEAVSGVSKQTANIDIQKSKYFPQISGGVNTGDLTSKHKGEQVLSLTATQMVYDFGKVKSSVSTEKALLNVEQAKVLDSIDSISFQVTSSIINIIKYQELIKISKQQISGVQDILNIANMRAKAGISSQADPIQAQSFLQSAQSQLILNESLLTQYESRLSNLLGFSSSNTAWKIPLNFVKSSGIYEELDFNMMPRMLIAKAELEAAQEQKNGVKLSRYPTISLKATASQALNRANSNLNNDKDFDSGIMLEATSNFYQGGAISAQNRAANFAEQMAKAKIQSIYLELDVALRNARSEVDNKQRQMEVLLARQHTSIKTRELYQEQYKLGTRSVLDLLNAEMSIHTSSTELETARYDIYQTLANFIQLSGKSRHIYQLNNKLIQGFEVKL